MYVDDLDRAVAFYQDVLELPVLLGDPRFCALNVGSKHVLLLFLRGASLVTTTLPGGEIPPPDGQGPIHVGFAVDTADLPAWESRLTAHCVEVVSRVDGPRGGRSIYFRDPDSHMPELLTPGVWTIDSPTASPPHQRLRPPPLHP